MYGVAFSVDFPVTFIWSAASLHAVTPEEITGFLAPC